MARLVSLKFIPLQTQDLTDLLAGRTHLFMPNMSFSVISNSIFLSVKDLRLGEFTNNITAPHEEHYFPTAVEGASSITTEFQFAGHEENDSETRFRSALSSLITANLLRKSQRTSFYVSPGRAKRYLLENIKAWFGNAIGADSTKRWIQERALDGDSIYMIVGIQTLINPRFTADSSSAFQVDGAVSFPFDLAPGVELVRPVLEGGRQGNASKTFEVAITGERLFALEYRKISFKWLYRMSRGQPEPRLSPTTRSWTCLGTVTRGTDEDDTSSERFSENGDDESDESVGNAIEVTIELENSIPDGDWIRSTNATVGSYIINNS